jgi:hypothetical protein
MTHKKGTVSFLRCHHCHVLTKIKCIVSQSSASDRILPSATHCRHRILTQMRCPTCCSRTRTASGGEGLWRPRDSSPHDLRPTVEKPLQLVPHCPRIHALLKFDEMRWSSSRRQAPVYVAAGIRTHAAAGQEHRPPCGAEDNRIGRPPSSWSRGELRRVHQLAKAFGWARGQGVGSVSGKHY